ncbi:aspartyl/glutamyl-tRNA amidotransferase subunit C [Spiroplasma sp. TIUS-1]|uniref:Asp-tRNA(Asn)/Glu-tRNA(Gln) amidotransferase subunit GatC n=1 Tax=Spiroplasma sp. TIUS-1 TaxID=216963 RepID=UPI0013975073|nr:Asp-tRNA(Asn)/Glu-tRNA(Gln) amidotransferase subunit GatC [Spiroplasma sp. TIUS-1]QHX36140.1 aspartyl/glutamyl-tRNA amidotransferase subunit C [Spiroplasma sp. TIUS-1]
MELNKKLVIEIANDIRISLDDKEINEIVKSEIEIRAKMEKIVKFEIKGDVEPLSFPFEIENTYLRDDKEISTLSRDDGLKNAKQVIDNYVILPRVVK